jgi:proteasome assembly chaperone (PAC2) family protein
MVLYRVLDGAGITEPTVVVAFDGWVDAGSAATTAAATIGDGGDLVATFDADQLYDYRARRPTLRIRDGRPAELTWPELELRRVHVGDRDVLVLSGPEPDFRWHELCAAAVEIARRFGVREWLSLGAIPAAVPHTRSVPLLGTQSVAGLLRGGVEPGPEGILQVPAAAVSVLDVAVAAEGIPAVGYFAQIPHYVSGPYPEAAVALLVAASRHLGPVLSSPELSEEARQMRTRLDAAAATDEATRAYVERLEATVDEARRPSGGDLIGEIERFLREGGSGGTDRPN